MEKQATFANSRIQRVRIQGFKNLLDVTLDLGQVNFVIGANGAGNTNLLEALSLLGWAANGRPNCMLERRGVRPAHRHSSALASASRNTIHLEAFSGSGTYRVVLREPKHGRASWRFVSERFESRGREIAVRTRTRGHVVFGDDDTKQVPLWPTPEDGIAGAVRAIRDSESVNRLTEQLMDFCIYAPCEQMLRETAMGAYRGWPLGLTGAGLGDGILSLRNDPMLWRRVVDEACALSEWAADAAIWSEWSPEVVVTDRFASPEDLWMGSSETDRGMLHMLFVLRLVLHPATPPACALEHVEEGLHPQVVQRLTERLQSILLEPNRPQLVLTTNSADVLNGIDVLNERVRLFSMSRDDQGAAQVRRVPSSDLLARLAKKETTLGELWGAGALGSTPVLHHSDVDKGTRR